VDLPVLHDPIKLRHLRNTRERIVNLLVVLVTVMVPAISQANTIIPSNDYIGSYGPIVLDFDGNNLIQISPANISGVSYNLFSQFTMDGHSVKLINSYSLNPNLVNDNTEADTIIIELTTTDASDVMDLIGNITLIGKTADVIILVPSTNKINCDGCEFSNVGRLVLATGQSQNSSISVFDSIRISGGVITVGEAGLKAEGATFVDILSQTVNVVGNIRTNTLGSLQAGQLVIDSIGSKEIAAGDLQILVGEYEYNLTKSTAEKVSASTYGAYLSSAVSIIESGNVHIESVSAVGDVQLNQTINVNAEYALASIYQGNNQILKESIQIKSASSIDVGGVLNAKSKITLSAIGSINVTDNLHAGIPNTQGGIVHLAAGGEIYLEGAVLGDNVYIAANDILNEGTIRAKQKLYLSAENVIQNQFGGFISADQVFLTSKENVVNGSFRPYKLEYAVNVARKAIFESGSHQDIPDDPEGTIKVAVNDLSGVILGKTIQIEAKEVWNINPYYVLHNGEENPTVSLDAALSDQVVIAAEDNITIKADVKFVNSSAIVEAYSGHLAIEAKIIDNERYRIQVNTAPGQEIPATFCVEEQRCVRQTNVSYEINITDQYVHYFSPPARMYSASNAVFIADTSFQNELSFIEVQGDLNFRVNQFLQTGFELQKNVLVVATEKHSRRYCDKKVFGVCVDYDTDRWTTTDENYYSLKTGDLPALLSVEGYIGGEGNGKFELVTVKVNN